jgi:uncharacterized SAM-binding protein YcdF (DUF218 family)
MLRSTTRHLLTVTTVVVLAWSVLFVSVWRASRRDDAAGQTSQMADAIVVLGAAQYAGRPSPVLRARLDHALALWQRGLAPTVMVTGGRADGDRYTEAEASRRYLRARGVPSSAIRAESEGRTTLVSMRNVAAQLTEDSVRRVLLVSDPFHMFRLSLLARIEGLEPYASPTQTSPISQNTRRELEYAVRETVAVPVDVVQSLARRYFR